MIKSLGSVEVPLLNAWGIVDDLRQRNIIFYDRFVPGLPVRI
jgi:hypothetical protein